MSSKRPYLLLATIILLWGINFIVSRFLSGIEPVRVSGILFGFFRYSLGALTMLFVIGYRREGLSVIREEIRPYKHILLLSALFSAVFVMASHMSAEFVSSGTTSIIVNLCPTLVLLYGTFYLRERLTPTKVIGFLLGLLGGLIFLWHSLVVSPGLELGISLALVAMLAWGSYTITLHYLEGANRYIVMTSSIMIVPFIILLALEGSVFILIFDFWSILGILFSGVLASGLAYVLYFTAIENLGAPRASSFLFLVPFVSVVGDFVLGEPPALVALIAGAITLIGVGLVKWSGSGETDQHAEQEL